MNEYRLYALILAGGITITIDGFYSIILYLKKPSYRKGERQTWLYDHSIRVIRILWGLTMMGIGWYLLGG